MNKPKFKVGDQVYFDIDGDNNWYNGEIIKITPGTDSFQEHWYEIAIEHNDEDNGIKTHEEYYEWREECRRKRDE